MRHGVGTAAVAWRGTRGSGAGESGHPRPGQWVGKGSALGTARLHVLPCRECVHASALLGHYTWCRATRAATQAGVHQC